MMETDEEYLSIGGIQHFTFCRRQWALLNIEQQWQENLKTTEGHILHERAHDELQTEKRGNLLISRGMAVISHTLGITGVCDVVEFHAAKDGIPIAGREGLWLPVPVEYKRGRPKEDDSDRLQLCCQAMCLEEMLACKPIETAYLFYGEPQRRTAVLLDESLRKKVTDTISEMNSMFKRQYTPKVKTSKSCNACSMKDICLPKLCKNQSASAYLKKRLEEWQ